jgi:hypothetical protein
MNNRQSFTISQIIRNHNQKRIVEKRNSYDEWRDQKNSIICNYEAMDKGAFLAKCTVLINFYLFFVSKIGFRVNVNLL